MAVHRTAADGWFDTPCNPIVGVLMFIVGFIVLMAGALFVAGELLR